MQAVVVAKLLPWLTNAFPLHLLLLLLVLPFLLLLRRSQPKKHGQLLPGPRRLPLVGNLHQLGSLPHHSLRALSLKHGPVMLLQLGRVPAVVVSSAAAAEEILRTHDLAFATRPDSSMADRLLYGSRDITFAKYGSDWRQMRRLCAVHLLNLRRLQSYCSVREEEVALLVDTIRAAADTPVNLSVLIVALTSGIASRIVFGHKYTGRGERFQMLMAEWMALLGSFPMRDFIPSLGWVDRLIGLDERTRKTAADLDSFMEEVIEWHLDKQARSAVDAEDFVDVLLSLGVDGADGITLTKDGVKAILLDLFGGGTDTAFSTIEWAMTELLRQPTKMERAKKEIATVLGSTRKITEEMVQGMAYLRAAIKETLRLHPPIPLLIPREAMRDTPVHGYIIPAGARVMVNAWAIGRDPASWGEKPEEFRPERFLDDGEGDAGVDFRGNHFHLLPFGGGRRRCPGVDFALPVIELALANLLHHFDWELPEGRRAEEMDMAEFFGIVVRKKESLILAPKPRPKDA